MSLPVGLVHNPTAIPSVDLSLGPMEPSNSFDEAHLGYLGGLLLFAAGVLMWWWQKRKFARTNEFGVERFPTFGSKVAARIKEAVAVYAALLFGIFGVLLLALQFQDSWGWIILLPAIALALFIVIGS